MLILFAVLGFVAIVGLGVTIFKKSVKNGIFIRKVGIFHDLNINETNFKLSYEEFCALVTNGGKMTKEEKYNSIMCSYDSKMYNDLINIKYYIEYFNQSKRLYSSRFNIIIGDREYCFLSDLDKKLICNDLYYIYEKQKLNSEYENNIESREYIINLIKKKLEKDREAYAEKLAKEKAEIIR